jgi:ribosomal protein S18 acetylase RimI-like enzyme
MNTDTRIRATHLPLSFLQRPVVPGDRRRIANLVESVEVFTAEEQAVAIELVDHQLQHPELDDYRFILAVPMVMPPASEELAGYLCYGRTPLTRSTYDLYWIATSPSYARSGVARSLVGAMESEIARAGGGLVRVETGSREGHGSAVRFYDAVGFDRAVTIAGFYAEDDDLLIFTRRVPAAARS